jgi:hypothetical protein
LHFPGISLRLVFPPPFQVTKALLSAGPKFEVFALVRSEERAAKALGSEANQVSAMFFSNLIFGPMSTVALRAQSGFGYL